MRTQTTKSTIEHWCNKHGFSLNWGARTVNNIPFTLADGDLYLSLFDEPSPAFTEEKFVDLVKCHKPLIQEISEFVLKYKSTP